MKHLLKRKTRSFRINEQTAKEEVLIQYHIDNAKHSADSSFLH